MKKLLIFLLIITGFIFLFSVLRGTFSEYPAPNPLHKLDYFGSVGIGKDKVEKGNASFMKNYTKLDSLSLYWYNLDEENKITRDESVSEKTEAETVSFAKENGIKVSLGISDHGEAQKADDFLGDEQNRKENIESIISVLESKGYDGVMIDYEDLRVEQEEEFTNYMKLLSAQIRSKGKELGISVPTETKGKITHGINLADISKIVDKMHLNVYEQHGKDTVPGPIASIAWTNDIIKNAVKQGVDPEKIILGTAHSGHNWIISPDEEFYKDMATDDTLELLQKTNAQLQWDNEKKANFFTYEDDSGKEHIVWLEDVKSFKSKIDLAKAYRLKGIFLWYLGGEDPEIWKII